jgi:hypothetical protein
MSAAGNYIDFDRMAAMENFTDASCLRFGREHDLFLQKIGRAMPWFVNAFSDLPVADFYRRKVDEILQLDEKSWQQRAPYIEQEDREASAGFIRQGFSHYAIKYNRFMGVISDFFLTEEQK